MSYRIGPYGHLEARRCSYNSSFGNWLYALPRPTASRWLVALGDADGKSWSVACEKEAGVVGEWRPRPDRRLNSGIPPLRDTGIEVLMHHING